MAIRVALIGTGNVGKPALVQLINDSRFELTGVWVSSAAARATTTTPAWWPRRRGW